MLLYNYIVGNLSSIGYNMLEGNWIKPFDKNQQEMCWFYNILKLIILKQHFYRIWLGNVFHNEEWLELSFKNTGVEILSFQVL